MEPSNKAAGSRGRRSGMNGAKASARKRVVIADSDPLARRVIRAALQDDHDFVVPAEAKTGVEAIELCGYYKPDAALLETDLGNGLDGIVAARKIREAAPGTKILMFSREDREDVQLAALAAGASGFIPKSADIAEVVQGLKHVIEGRAAIPPRTTMVLIQRLRMLPEGGRGHPAGAQRADAPRVGDPRPAEPAARHPRDRGDPRADRGDRVQPREEHPAQARGSLAPRGGRARPRAARPARGTDAAGGGVAVTSA